MKKYAVITLLLFTTMSLQAQTWKEWFRQRKTQISYLKEQIAALKVYGDYTRKGYMIAKEGLTAIGVIKEGDFFQHRDYFASLSKVNPKIKTYWKVAAIISFGLNVQQLYQEHHRLVSESGQFTDRERTYLNSVFTHLLDGCTDLIEQAVRLTTGDGFEMKDNERLRRMDDLYADMQDRYAFARTLSRRLRRWSCIDCRKPGR